MTIERRTPEKHLDVGFQQAIVLQFRKVSVPGYWVVFMKCKICQARSNPIDKNSFHQTI